MQQFITDRLPEIEELCRTHHVRRLSVFGSAVRDDFNPKTSDVDFRVEFMPPQAIPRPADNYFTLVASLAGTLGRKVHLASARILRNPYFRENVEREMITIYAA